MDLAPLLLSLEDETAVGIGASEHLAAVVARRPDLRPNLIASLGSLPDYARARVTQALGGIRPGEVEFRASVLTDLQKSTDYRVVNAALTAASGSVGVDTEITSQVMRQASRNDPNTASMAIQCLRPIVTRNDIQLLLATVIASGHDVSKQMALKVMYGPEALDRTAPTAEPGTFVIPATPDREDAVRSVEALQDAARTLLDFLETDEQRDLLDDEVLPALEELLRLLTSPIEEPSLVPEARSRTRTLLLTPVHTARGLAIGLGNTAPKINAIIQLAERVYSFYDKIPPLS